MILAQADTINVGNDAVEKVYVGDNLVYTQSFLSEFPSAAAAFSLRNLTNQDLNVIRVKRTSDFSESDFTATELTDGTLLNFVNADQTDYMVFDGISNNIEVDSALLPATGDFTLTIEFYIAQFLSVSELNVFSQGSAGTTGRSIVQVKNAKAYASVSGAGDLTSVKFVSERNWNTIIFSRSGTTLSLKLNDETAVTLTSSQAIEQTDSEIGDCGYTGSDFNNVIKSLSVGSTTWDGTESDATSKGWTVNGSPSSTRFNDGHVVKWYDQSGNGKHATATDPNIPSGSTNRDEVFFDFKIVSSGSYLEHIEVDTEFGLELDSGINGTPPLSIFAVYSGGRFVATSDPYGNYLTAAGRLQLVNARYLTSSVSADSNVNVVSFLSRGSSTNSLIFSSQNTTYPGMGFMASGSATTTSDHDPIITIFGDDINGYTGKALELIIYQVNKSTVFANIAVNQRDAFSI